jgi:hypothetical protein
MVPRIQIWVGSSTARLQLQALAHHDGQARGGQQASYDRLLHPDTRQGPWKVRTACPPLTF